MNKDFKEKARLKKIDVEMADTTIIKTEKVNKKKLAKSYNKEMIFLFKAIELFIVKDKPVFDKKVITGKLKSV